MMTCKDVSAIVASGQLTTAPAGQRLAVWFHLAMCRHCRAFRRQLDALARAVQSRASAYAAEPSPAFERAIVDRLRDEKRS